MWFIELIIEQLTSAEEWLHNAYLEVSSWIMPFNYLAFPLHGLYSTFYYLRFYFSYFNEWLAWAADRLDQLLSWENIRALIKTYWPNIDTALSWFANWAAWVRQEINQWWLAKQPLVFSWIAAASQGLDTLNAQWHNFWQVTWPTLVSYANLELWWGSKEKEVTKLIDDGFMERQPFWAGWQDMRESVVLFFSDPEEWLYKAVDRIIERFW